MRSRLRPTLVPAVALLLTLAACGGAAAATPSDAVYEAFDRIDAGDLAGLLDLTCEAQRDTLREQFDFSDMAGLLPGDADLSALFEALNLDTSALEVAEGDISGDSADVHLGGSLGFSFDAERLRDVLRAAVEAQGVSIDEQQLDSLVTVLGTTSQDIPLDQTLSMAREGGGWRICSRLTLLG